MPNKLTKSLPKKPGVYLFKDCSGKIIYVGKAINLKSRVSSYFRQDLGLGPKTRALASQITDIDYVLVESEIEALLLEAALIKKHNPFYNISGKDDKHPLYIQITKEEIPKVKTVRKTEIQAKATVFGPFPSSTTVRQVLKTLRRVFPYCTCTDNRNKPCLYVHLGLCQRESPQYQQNISYLKDFLNNKRPSVIKKMTTEMKKKVSQQNFEEAAKIRDQIQQLTYITQNFRQAHEYLKNPNLVADQRKQELESLSLFLKEKIGRDVWPEKIETYDISNIGGKEATGAMVTFVGGQEEKNMYRKFRIRFKKTPDDTAMIKEILKRRLIHEDWQYPDLILIDGGKGQVNAGLSVLDQFSLNIPLLGLAKRAEELIWWNNEKKEFEIISLPKNSPALMLLIRTRNEAHRFALNYHRLLRRKSVRIN